MQRPRCALALLGVLALLPLALADSREQVSFNCIMRKMLTRALTKTSVNIPSCALHNLAAPRCHADRRSVMRFEKHMKSDIRSRAVLSCVSVWTSLALRSLGMPVQPWCELLIAGLLE